MPRCYTIKKINAQQQSIQQYCYNNTRKGNRRSGNSNSVIVIGGNRGGGSGGGGGANNNRIDDASNAVSYAEDDDENINNDRVNRIAATIGGGARTNKVRNDCNTTTTAAVATAATTTTKNRVRGRNGNNGNGSMGLHSIDENGNGNGTNNDDGRSRFVSGRNELKATAVQSKKLVNGTRAAVVQQRQCKDDNTGPTSPTEATVAPIYYTNANAHESKMGKRDFCAIFSLFFPALFI